MYETLHKVLQDQTGGAVFGLFNIWHILYLALLVSGIIAMLLLFRNQTNQAKNHLINWTITGAFLLYMLDFFVMPFSYGYIDIDKLPFHICTLMGILCFVSRHNAFFGKFKITFSVMGLIGGLMYVAYPSGVADGEVCIFSYRITQTLIYHGMMIAQGVYTLAFDDSKPQWKTCWKDAVTVALMVIWATIGNTLYAGVENGRTFNWFFVSSDPLGIVPDTIAPFVMPFVMIVVIFGMDICIRLIYHLSTKSFPKKHAEVC